ncbi:hypothetical protein L1887_02442 [Cichorium endivia]|nr:hypothetical protein L1887_02442 [Cichorium endivia]
MIATCINAYHKLLHSHQLRSSQPSWLHIGLRLGQECVWIVVPTPNQQTPDRASDFTLLKVELRAGSINSGLQCTSLLWTATASPMQTDLKRSSSDTPPLQISSQP